MKKQPAVAIDDGLEEAAHYYTKRLGRSAVSYLNELADIDFDRGDKLSADTWRDIASAAARIVGAKAAA